MIIRTFLVTSAAAALCLAGCSNSSETSTPEPATEQVIKVGTHAVIKSALDKREYAYQTLDNGLKVVVVSDPDADKAAAALDVHIGHLADPADREGLTHFLEHMLFLGTEKYPEVGEYSKFISKHGGFNNAGTGMEHTNYFFQIDNDYLEPALDRFSRFFIDPLFSPEYVEKERNAVHSEYSLKVKEDGRRYREAVKQTANQAHPMTQFSVGNLDTLSNSDASTILEAVKTQYDQYYSADIMSLAIIGNYPVEELMEWAETKFSPVPSKGDTRDMDRPDPYLEDQTGVQITVNTLEDKRSLRLNFALPSVTEHFDAKPVAYISDRLGHEGSGTLFDVLKSKNYLKNLWTSTWGPDDFTRLTVHFDLTNEGYENLDEIIDYFFSYTELIRQDGISKQAYEEIGDLADIKFEYQDKFSISSFASMLTGNLQYYPPQNALDQSRLYEDFDKQLIESYLDNIRPENARVIVATPDFDAETKEARYDVAYKMEPIADNRLAQWSNYSRKDEVSLPSLNPYVPEDLDVMASSDMTIPVLTVDQPALKLWHLNQNEFELPKADLSFRVYPADSYKSDAHKLAVELHTRIIGDLMSAESYPASQAGLYYGVTSAAGRGYNIGVQGYNDKIDIFLDTMLGKLSPDQINQDVFDRMKSNMVQDIKNRAFARPYNQVRSAFFVERNGEALTNEEQLTVLNDLDFETFKSIITDSLSQVEIEGIFIGNIGQSEVKSVGKTLKSYFGDRLAPDSKNPMIQIELAESDEDLIRNVDVNHNDSTIYWMFQGDSTSIKDQAKMRLIRQILGNRFYKSLRTDQQYGYVVGMGNSTMDNRPYAGFLIQSPKAHPVVLKEKIEEFMDEQVEYLETISDEEFQGHVDGLLSTINKKYDNIYVKGSAMHQEIISGNLDFDTRKKMTDAVNALTPADMLGFFKSEFMSDKRRSIILWNVGQAHADYSEFDLGSYEICETRHCIFGRSVD